MTQVLKQELCWLAYDEVDCQNHIVQYEEPNGFYWLITSKIEDNTPCIEISWKENLDDWTLPQLCEYRFDCTTVDDLIVEKFVVDKTNCVIYYVWAYDMGDPPGGNNGYWVAFNSEEHARIWWNDNHQDHDRALFLLTTFQ